MGMCSNIFRLTGAATGLLVIDIQDRLLPAMNEPERVVQNAVRLVKGGAILGIPALFTEQYRKGLGPTVAAIASAVPEFAAMEKMAFSACGAAGFVEALQAKRVSNVLLCGIESHVCVSQTCLDLLEQDYRVFVVADAVSSRTVENCRIGIERMRDAGAVIVSTEMALLELCGAAGTPEFKQLLPLIK